MIATAVNERMIKICTNIVFVNSKTNTTKKKNIVHLKMKS